MSVETYQNAFSTVEKQLGYTSFFGSPKAATDLTPDELQKVTDGVAAYIVANKDQFDEGQIAAAQNRLGSAVYGAPLQDNSFTSNLSDFGSNVEDNVIDAGNKVASVGQGALTLVDWSKYLIPIAGVFIVGTLLFAFYKKQTK